MKKRNLTFLLFLVSSTLFGQTKFFFDKDGKMHGAYPTVITPGHRLEFESRFSKKDTTLQKKVEAYQKSNANKTIHYKPNVDPTIKDLADKPDNDTTIHKKFESVYGQIKGFLLSSILPVPKPTKGFDIKFIANKNDGSSETKVDTTVDVKTGIISLNSKPEDENLDFTLIKIQDDNTMVANHLTDSRKFYKGFGSAKPILNELKAFALSKQEDIQNITNELNKDTLSVFERCCGLLNVRINEPVLAKIKTFEPNLERVNQLFEKVICDNQKWISSWLWMTNEVKLNPFPAPPADEDQLSTEIIVLQERIRILNQSICCKSPTETITYEKADKQVIALTKELVEKRIALANLEKQKIAYKKWLNSISKSTVAVNNSIIYNSTPDRLTWMHHYDADKKYFLQNHLAELPTTVADIDEVVALVHNVPADVEILMKAKIDTIPLKSVLDVALEPWFDAFQEALKAVNPIKLIAGNFNFNQRAIPDRLSGARLADAQLTKEAVGVFEAAKKHVDALKTLAPLDKVSKIQEMEKEWRNPKSKIQAPSNTRVKNKVITMIEDEANYKKAVKEVDSLDYYQTVVEPGIDYAEKVKRFIQTIKRLEWLLNQTEPILDITLEEEENPLYRTVDEFAEQPFVKHITSKVTYEISEKKENGAKVVIKNTYQRYEQIRFWPAVGVSYVSRPREVALFEKGSFLADSTIRPVEAVVGVKFYLKSRNLTVDRKTRKILKGLPGGRVPKNFTEELIGDEYNLKRGNNWLNATSVFFGVGVTHNFLKNYFLGAAYDIIPGLSVQAGGNLYFQKRYELSNGQVKNQFETPRLKFQFGLMIDPTVATKLVSLFKF